MNPCAAWGDPGTADGPGGGGQHDGQKAMRWMIGLAAGLVLVAGAAQVAHPGERWNMPTAHAETNYHTENARLFAEAVGICTGGALEITVHANRNTLQGRRDQARGRDRPGGHRGSAF